MKTTKRTVELLPGTNLTIQPDENYRHPLLYNVTQSGFLVGGLRHSISRTGYASFGLYSVIKGNIILKTKNRTFEAHTGDTLFFSQEDEHTLQNCGTVPYEADFAYLYGPNVNKFFDCFYKKTGCVMHDYTPPSFHSVITEITESIKTHTDNKYRVSALLYGVLTEILQKCDNDEKQIDITDAVKYVREHYNEKITLDYLAGTVFMNKYYFIRQFHSITGFTPKEYQNELRFNKAVELLSQTSMTVSDIAKQVGFPDSRGLISLFKEKKGCSPSVWRNNH